MGPDDVEWVEEGYRLFRDGDPAFLDRYTPDATIVIPATLPSGGVYESPFDALEFWNSIGELEGARPEPGEMMRSGDRLIVLGAFRALSRSSGQPVAIRFLHAFHVPAPEAPLRDQRLASFELFADTVAFRLALSGEGGERSLPSPQLGQTRVPTGPPVATGLSADDREWVLEGYRLFRDHDPSYLERWAPDATFAVPETLPAGGTYRSPWESLVFTTTVSDLVDDPHPVPEELIRDGNRLVVLGTWRATIRATGRRVGVRVAHAFTTSDAHPPLRGQQLTGFELFADTAALAAALAEAEAG